MTNLVKVTRAIWVRSCLTWFWGFVFLLAAFSAFPGSKWAIGLGYAFLTSLLAGLVQAVQASALAVIQNENYQAQSIRRGLFELHRGSLFDDEMAGEFWKRHLNDAQEEIAEDEAFQREADKIGVPRWLRVSGVVLWDVIGTLILIAVAMMLTG